MNKTKLLISLILISSLLYMAYVYKNKFDEETLIYCINGVQTTLKIDNIEVDTADRINSPIISGKTSTKLKKQFLKLIAGECKVQSFVDLIVENNDYDIKISSINFKLDGFNKIGTITGMVNSAFEQKDILSSFTTAVNKHYGPWTIKHEILIYKQVKKNEFSIDISLVFSALSQVKLTDITFINNQLIIKGLVRNSTIEHQTISLLYQIFQDELEIINQLEAVIKQDNDIEGLEIEFEPIELPDLKRGNKSKNK